MLTDDHLHNTSPLAEIRQEFGFIPPFFVHAQSAPSLLTAFWQQTQAMYIDNPLPHHFKEKLFIYLSYTCKIPYDLRCHCLTLHKYGLKEAEIITLLQTPPPTEQDITIHLNQIRSVPQALQAWPENLTLELALFTCSTHLFMQQHLATPCRQELQRLLGVHYVFLTALMTYIRTCHNWIECAPESQEHNDPEIEKHFERIFGKQTLLSRLLDTQHLQITQERQEIISHIQNKQTVKSEQTIHNEQLDQRVQQSLKAILSVAEYFVLGQEQRSHNGENQVGVQAENQNPIPQAMAHLIALVIERTKLIQAHTEAQTRELALQESNQRMNDFLSIAAHEIKTPLTTIKGSIQMLLRRAQDEVHATQSLSTSPEERKRTKEAAQHLLSRADAQIKRLTRLIDGILYVSRIQDGKLNFTFERHNLADVLREVLCQQRQLNPERLIEVRGSLPAAPVFIDQDHIEQVIINYLTNALKYSEVTQPVEISLQIEEPQRQVRLSVQDHGPGITPEDQKHIWERFYRVQSTEVKTGSTIGLGLGLYISHSIIKEHGGSVGLSSTPGQGTTFWFTLHLADKA